MADSMATLDMANDGVATRLAHLSLSSGAAAGCDKEFFDALNPSGEDWDAGHYHELAMRVQHADADADNGFPVPRCGNRSRFFRYEDKIYFENKLAQWPPVDIWNRYHRVSRADAGQVRDVCGITFQSHVSFREGIPPPAKRAQ